MLALRMVGAVALLLATYESAIAEQTSDYLTRLLSSRLGTQSATAGPYFVEGRLMGCTIEFVHLMRDWAYKQGGFIRVGGSFGTMASGNGSLAAVLKVIIHDIDPADASLTPSPPTNAHFVDGTRSNIADKIGAYPSDVPGALFTVFKPFPAIEMMVSGLAKNELGFAFNRRMGGTDIRVQIDTTVENTTEDGRRVRSAKAANDFMDCSRQLLKSLSQ